MVGRSAIIIPKTFGGHPKPVTVSGCDGWLVSSTRGAYVAVWAGFRVASPRLRRTAPWGTQWGQLDGPRGSRRLRPRGTPGPGAGLLAHAATF